LTHKKFSTLIGDWRLEIRDWRRVEIGDWRLEIGDWGLGIKIGDKDWRLEKKKSY